MVLISIAYFRRDQSGASLPRRLVTSAHGAALAVIYTSAVLINITGHAELSLVEIVLLSHLAPVTLIVISIVWYQGPKDTHVMQLYLVILLILSAIVSSLAAGVSAF